MLTEEDYCDYETCVALRKLGFIGQGRCYYDLDKEPNKLRHSVIQVLSTRSAEALNFVLAVHLYDAQKWLREEHQLHIEVRYYQNLWYEYELKEAEGKILAEGSAFKTFEDALNTAVYMATEHLKELKPTIVAEGSIYDSEGTTESLRFKVMEE